MLKAKKISKLFVLLKIEIVIIILLTIFNFFQSKALIKNLGYHKLDINSMLMVTALKTLIFGIVIYVIPKILSKFFRNKKVSTITSTPDPSSPNDKLLEKYTELNKYADEIAASMAELATFTEDQTAYIEQFSAALTEVSNGVQQTSENTQQAADFVANVTSSVSVFANSIEEVAIIAQEVSTESENAKVTAKSGEKVIIDAINEMNNVSVRIKELVDHITLLGESTQEIDEILEVINNISNQTNILALNASIEAARAGEYGRGFAVVAKSIKELADKSKDATSNISIIIKNIQKSVGESVIRSNNGLKELELGINLVKSTGNSIDEILAAVDKTFSHSITLAQSTKVQDEASKEIMNSVNELKNIIEDISATTAEESAGIQQVAAGVEIIKESVDAISAGNSEISNSTNYIGNIIKGLLDEK